MNFDNPTFSFLVLPEEIILHIATYLTTFDLFQGLGRTCWYLNSLVKNASGYGTVSNFLFLPNTVYLKYNIDEQKDLTKRIVELCSPVKGIEFEGHEDSKLLHDILSTACNSSFVTSLIFKRYIIKLAIV